MPFEECPKCHKWSVNYDSVRQEKRCSNPDCGYEISYPREKYLIENDVLPKLAKSLELGKRRF